jgi:hypothetical protein
MPLRLRLDRALVSGDGDTNDGNDKDATHDDGGVLVVWITGTNASTMNQDDDDDVDVMVRIIITAKVVVASTAIPKPMNCIPSCFCFILFEDITLVL